MDHLFEEISAKVNDLLLEQGRDGATLHRSQLQTSTLPERAMR